MAAVDKCTAAKRAAGTKYEEGLICKTDVNKKMGSLYAGDTGNFSREKRIILLSDLFSLLMRDLCAQCEKAVCS